MVAIWRAFWSVSLIEVVNKDHELLNFSSVRQCDNDTSMKAKMDKMTHRNTR